MSIMDAIYKKLLLALCFLLLSGVLHAQGVYLNKGDIAFAEGLYSEALDLFCLRTFL